MATPIEGQSVQPAQRPSAQELDLRQYGSCSLLDGSCQTCGEGAVPVIVQSVAGNTAVVQDREGTRAEVATDFVAGVQVGDVLLVQAGLALSRVEVSA